jgi:hypothetical protein
LRHKIVTQASKIRPFAKNVGHLLTERDQFYINLMITAEYSLR